MAGVEPSGAEAGLEFRPSTARALWVVAAVCAATAAKNLFKVRLKHADEPLMWGAAVGMPLLFLLVAWFWACWALPRRILAGEEGLEIHGWNSRDRLAWANLREVRLVNRPWSPTRWILEDREGRTRTLYRLGLGEEDWEALGIVLQARGVPRG